VARSGELKTGDASCSRGRRKTAPARTVGYSHTEVRRLAGGCRPTLSPTALPVAEQSSRAGAVTGVGVKQQRIAGPGGRRVSQRAGASPARRYIGKSAILTAAPPALHPATRGIQSSSILGRHTVGLEKHVSTRTAVSTSIEARGPRPGTGGTCAGSCLSRCFRIPVRNVRIGAHRWIARGQYRSGLWALSRSGTRPRPESRTPPQRIGRAAISD
jgi:hypothetical protein